MNQPDNGQKALAKSEAATDAVAVLLDRARPKLREVLPRHLDEGRFFRIVVSAFNRNPDLLSCVQDEGGRRSMLLAVLDAARLGLEPDGQQGALVPYKGKIQFQTMYQGLVELAWAGSQTAVEAAVVYAADAFDYSRGFEPRLVHRPALVGDQGDVVAVYALARIPGAPVPLAAVLRFDEVEKVRKSSRNADGPAWTQWWSEMAKKTAAKRVLKMVPKSPAMKRAFELDAAAESGEEASPIEDLPIDTAAPLSRPQAEIVKDKLRAQLAEPPAATTPAPGPIVEASAQVRPAQTQVTQPPAPLPPESSEAINHFDRVGMSFAERQPFIFELVGRSIPAQMTVADWITVRDALAKLPSKVPAVPVEEPVPT